MKRFIFNVLSVVPSLAASALVLYGYVKIAQYINTQDNADFLREKQKLLELQNRPESGKN